MLLLYCFIELNSDRSWVTWRLKCTLGHIPLSWSLYTSVFVVSVLFCFYFAHTCFEPLYYGHIAVTLYFLSLSFSNNSANTPSSNCATTTVAVQTKPSSTRSLARWSTATGISAVSAKLCLSLRSFWAISSLLWSRRRCSRFWHAITPVTRRCCEPIRASSVGWCVVVWSDRFLLARVVAALLYSVFDPEPVVKCLHYHNTSREIHRERARWDNLASVSIADIRNHFRVPTTVTVVGLKVGAFVIFFNPLWPINRFCVSIYVETIYRRHT